MTKAELARELGVSRSYITMIQQGKRQPSKKMQKRLYNLTNVRSLPDTVLLGPKSCSSANSDTPPRSNMLNILTFRAKIHNTLCTAGSLEGSCLNPGLMSL